MSSGTFDATEFDRFLSEGCVAPDCVIITGQSKEDILLTLESILSFDEFCEHMKRTDRLRWVEMLEGSWEEIDNNADSS